MSDRVFFATILAIAAVLIAVAFVWPQGFGRRAPGPFGKPEVMSAAAQADLAGTTKAAARRKGLAAPHAGPAVAVKK